MGASAVGRLPYLALSISNLHRDGLVVLAQDAFPIIWSIAYDDWSDRVEFRLGASGMGLFDKGGKTAVDDGAALSAPEAFAAIALAAVASDGYLSDEEAQSIPFILSRMQLFKSYSDDMMRRLFDKLLARLQTRGVDGLFVSAKDSLDADLRETAFIVATDLVLADGVVTEEEEKFLKDLEDKLEISGELALQVVRVMKIKNRG